MPRDCGSRVLPSPCIAKARPIGGGLKLLLLLDRVEGSQDNIVEKAIGPKDGPISALGR